MGPNITMMPPMISLSLGIVLFLQFARFAACVDGVHAGRVDVIRDPL
jgi:hypothetical protein